MPTRLPPLQRRFAPLAPGLVRFLLVLGQFQRHEAVEIGIGRLAQRAVHAERNRLLGEASGERRQ